MACAEGMQAILAEPLDYLHPQRLCVPAQFRGSEARQVLNRIVFEGLQLQSPWPATELSATARQWVLHWWQLPYIAGLMGAWRLMPELTRGGALLRLPLSMRRFASCSLGVRGALPIDCPVISMQVVEAAGLNALCGWYEQVPALLIERLLLQFSPPVVRLHEQWPMAKPDPALFHMAVQHARLYPNPD
ncbi:secretion system protein [Pseudomonas sp. REP124]|uniref:secretion system protein n=1 Tax=Pseudomonas sp. REP124 TaxID=2875731 RepID=UPI001CCC2B22|nr:secretion system protein [Pseudomonas sp. REP124]MBZ9781918.1 secretion system protein [Pseudomonas sp. REP124]